MTSVFKNSTNGYNETFDVLDTDFNIASASPDEISRISSTLSDVIGIDEGTFRRCLDDFCDGTSNNRAQVEAFLMAVYCHKLSQVKADEEVNPVTSKMQAYFGFSFTSEIGSQLENAFCKVLMTDFENVINGSCNEFLDVKVRKLLKGMAFIIVQCFIKIVVDEVFCFSLSKNIFIDGFIYQLSKVDKEPAFRLLVKFMVEHLSVDTLTSFYTPIFQKLRKLAIDRRATRQIALTSTQVIHAELQWFPLVILSRLISLDENTKSPFNLLDVLANQRNFCYDFSLKDTPCYMSMDTYLGPFFALGIFDNGDMECSREMNRIFEGQEVEGISNSALARQIRDIHSNIRRHLLTICQALVTKTTTRQVTTQYLVDVILATEGRGKYHFEKSEHVGHVFMMNFLHVVISLASKVRLENLDFNYLARRSCQFPVHDLTKINMTTQEGEDFCKQFDGQEEKFNFNTTIFYVAIFAIHTGFQPLINEFTSCKRDWGYVKKDLKKLRETYEREVERGNHSEIIRTFMQFRMHEESTRQLKYCLMSSIVMLYDQAITRVLAPFMDKLSLFLLDTLHPDAKKNFIPDTASDLFKFLPEMIIEHILSIFQFMETDRSGNGYCLPLVQRFLIVLSVSPHYFKAPFNYAKFLEVIVQAWSHARTQMSLNYYQQILINNSTNSKITPILLKFYCDVESTGASSEFYDKFNIRRCIHFILERFWEHSNQKLMLIKTMNSISQEMLRFANIVIGDSTFLFDEVVGGMKKAVSLEKELLELRKNSSRDTDEIKNKQSKYDEAVRGVTSWIHTLSESLDLLKKLTDYSPKVFMNQLIGERLAALLNYNLVELSPPNHLAFVSWKNLANELGFSGRALVTKIIAVYNALSTQQFAKFVAFDERSFTSERFRNIFNGIRDVFGISGVLMERFSVFLQMAYIEYDSKMEEEEDFGDDVPDEFRDPVMDNVMLDPVKLPSSGQIMDRKNIIKHLLNIQIDPFNRQPLKQEDLIPLPDLQKKIAEWIQEKKKARQH
uniref:RING-type E3 ubiquitin transferase n=1 Tax=Strongyloides papillosus TaxID=174720 RepID=A0A0N5B8X5_STREA